MLSSLLWTTLALAQSPALPPAPPAVGLPSATLPSAPYEQQRLVRRVTDHHWTETVIQTDYSSDTAVTTARNVQRQSRQWGVQTGVGTPVVTTTDFAERVGDHDMLSALDRQTKNTRLIAIAGVAGGLATSVLSYTALRNSDAAPSGLGVMLPSLGISVAGLSILPHLGALRKRGSVHFAYSEPEVDAWIRRHNDALAQETGSVAARAAYPDVEQVTSYQ